MLASSLGLTEYDDRLDELSAEHMLERDEASVAVLRDFHDRLASSGSLPLGLAERAVMAGLPTA